MRTTSRRLAGWTACHSILVVLSLLFIAADSDCEVPEDPAPAASSAPRPSPIPTVSVGDIKGMVIPNIVNQEVVIDAAMTQDGKTVNLVLVVSYAINMSYAQQLSENFVRMTKSLLKDGEVGKEIGRGEYDYLIGVYYPNEDLVGMGAKARASLGDSGSTRLSGLRT